MKHQFRTSAEMYAAGYAPGEYNIMSDSQVWRLPNGKRVKTIHIEAERNERPDVDIAPISLILASERKS
jgi:hypothetical protein